MFRVLIVDDDRVVRYILKRYKNWEKYGFTIEAEACDGREALKMLQLYEIDLIITDIKMPGMDGIELMQELKRLNYDTCVIFLSTHSDFEYAKQGIRLGVFDYMTKPIEEDVIGEVLKRTKSYLDDKKNNISANIGIYFPKDREKHLGELLMSGDKELFVETEIIFLNLLAAFENEMVKTVLVANKILYILFNIINKAYPWVGKIEKPHFDILNESGKKPEELKGIFMDDICYLFDIVKKYELHQKDSIIKKTCEYVLSHVEGDLRLDKISNEVHVRSDYVGKLFKKKTGCNLNDYITMIKMEHAKHLIKSGDYKNYEISDKLGYSSSDYFCRLFKGYAGCTPTEFRKAN